MKDVIDRLARIETKLDTWGPDHETRIRSLERWRWILAGGGVVCLFIARLILKA